MTYQVNHYSKQTFRWTLCPGYKTHRKQGGVLSPVEWNFGQVEKNWALQCGCPKARHDELVGRLLGLEFDKFEARDLALFNEVTVRRLFNLN